MEWIHILLILLINYSSFIQTYDFQCLTCDNFIDGSGCGEYTKQIPVRTCRTFCYFAIIYNRSFLSSTRAIRDCSPYDDISIEGNLLLQSKVGSLISSIDIITIKRCNSEQCNNDFYLQTDELLLGKSSSYYQISFPILFSSFLIFFYYSKNMF